MYRAQEKVVVTLGPGVHVGEDKVNINVSPECILSRMSGASAALYMIASRQYSYNIS